MVIVLGLGRYHVFMPESAQPNIEFKLSSGLGVNIKITNTGLVNATNIYWQIHVEGGILGRINKTMNGTIDILTGETKTVGTGIFLGFGPISITAQVANKEQTATGTQIIVFTIIK